MMSVSARKAGAAVSYYTHLKEDAHLFDGLRKEDYYSRGEGYWHGKGAEALGLSGQVREADFRSACLGFAPRTGEALAQNAGNETRTALYDCTFSAPKSVSVVWAIGEEDVQKMIEGAHDLAVKKTLDEMEERFVWTRRGRDGMDAEKVGVVAATWRHGTSRDLDPQIHTHATILNVCQRADGTGGTIDGRQFYEYQKVLGVVYRLHLEERIRQLGWRTERDGESFRICSVPRAVEARLSKGRARIEAEMAARGTSGARAAEAANLATRAKKNYEATPDELRGGWVKECGAVFRAREAIPGEAVGAAREKISAPEVLRGATEYEAVLKGKEVEFAALVGVAGTGQGRAAGEYLREQAMGQAVSLVNDRGESRYTTRELLEKERAIIEMTRAGAGERAHILSAQAVAAAVAKFERARSYSLTPEQRAAVVTLATRPGRDVVLIGDAGTGKTTALAALKLAYEEGGYRVIGTATDGKKAADLQRDLGVQCSTIDKLAGDLKRGADQLSARTVVLVDEAGRVDARRWHQLKSLADERGAKVVWAGDHKQLQAVGAGSPFRHVAGEAACARLSEIHRQRDAGEREAVRQISRGEAARAMLGYIDRGQVSVARTHRAACREIADKYVRAADQVGKGQVLALALTNKRVEDVNAVIRARYQARGELAGGREYEAVRERGIDRSTGEVRTERVRTEFAAGDRVLHAGRNDYRNDLRRGELGSVLRVEERGVTVKLDRDGREVLIDPARHDLRHGYAITVDRSQGMTVERPIVYLSGDMTREYGYVAASRGREATEFVTTASAVQQTAREVGKEISNPQLGDLREVVMAMSQSRQAESTLDWRVAASRGQDKQQEHERGI